jgi:hypothetical protein
MNGGKSQDLVDPNPGCESLRAQLSRGRRTSFGEQGKSVFVRPLPGERVTFYCVDGPAFRQYFGCQKSCDLVIHRVPTKGSEVIAYVEVKGRDAARAVKQLTETISRTRRCFQEARPEAIFRASLVMKGSAPRRDEPLRKKFKDETGITLKVMSTNGKQEMGPWLRGR